MIFAIWWIAMLYTILPYATDYSGATVWSLQAGGLQCQRAAAPAHRNCIVEVKVAVERDPTIVDVAFKLQQFIGSWNNSSS
jgi:hypothetical protein